jgi:hypothetical protein
VVSQLVPDRPEDAIAIEASKVAVFGVIILFVTADKKCILSYLLYIYIYIHIYIYIYIYIYIFTNWRLLLSPPRDATYDLRWTALKK